MPGFLLKDMITSLKILFLVLTRFFLNFACEITKYLFFERSGFEVILVVLNSNFHGVVMMEDHYNEKLKKFSDLF